MDINDFADENFDAVAFLNKTLTNDGVNKEEQVANLLSKFQLYVQQVNSAIEESSQQIFINLPKIMKDAKTLQLSATTCRQKIHEIQTEITDVQKNTGSCMENLENLDNLATKLSIAKHGLQESDGWGRSTTELEDFLEQGNVLEACNKLFSLQRSLAVQRGLPGQVEREEQLEDFKNQIEALISPDVVASFTSGDVDASRKYVDLFAKMERSSQLVQYYKTVQKRILLDHWQQEAAVEHCSIKFLREFYEYLLEFWDKQANKFCTKVFGTENAAYEPTNIVSELLMTLQPSRETIINNFLKRSNEKLEILQEMSAANIYFGAAMQKNLQQVKPEARKLLSLAIFDYFSTYYDHYVQSEQIILEENLNELKCFQTNAAESVRNLDSANHKMLTWAQQSLKRCEEITQNCAFSSVFNVLNMFFKGFLDKCKKVQRQLDATRSANDDGWILLPISITFLQSLGELLLNILKIDKTLCDTISKINLTVNDPNQLFQYRITNAKDLSSLKKLIITIKESEKEAEMQGGEAKKLVVLGGLLPILKPIIEESHDFMLGLVFSPVEKYLETMEPPKAATNDDNPDLPDFSFSPQEYITQIGQYMLTLPQHLEPLLLTPSQALKIALEVSDPKYESNSAGADVLLSLIADETCALYQEKIGQITNISTAGAKQMSTDIEYLINVMEELGLSGRHLEKMCNSFKKNYSKKKVMK